jgi:tetratricopeptide (TPR) repeat protein
MERVSAMYNNVGNSYRNRGDITKCLEYHMESLRIKEEIKVDDEALAASYWNIGNIQGDVNNLPESNIWYRKAENIYEELQLDQDLVAIRYNLGLNLREMDSLDRALEYFNSAIEFYKENDLWNDLAAAYDNLGGIYRDDEKYEIAESYYLRSLNISKDHGEKTLVGLTQRRLGRLYTRMERFDEAEPLLNSALQISKETGVRKKMITDYLALAELYEAKKDFRRAYDFHVQYAELENEVLNEESLERINELEIKYQTEQKEKEIIIQQNQIELLEQKARIARIQNIMLILGILGFAIVFGSVYYGLRQRFRRIRLEKEQLDSELSLKRKELTGFTMQLAHKNEVLESLKEDLAAIRKEANGVRSNINKVIRTIDYNLQDDEGWDQFKRRFEEVHRDFNKTVKEKYPSVTANDLRLMALIKMNMSSKEIASLLNISPEGVKKARYRLKRKMELETEESLTDVVLGI